MASPFVVASRPGIIYELFCLRPGLRFRIGTSQRYHFSSSVLFARPKSIQAKRNRLHIWIDGSHLVFVCWDSIRGCFWFNLPKSRAQNFVAVETFRVLDRIVYYRIKRSRSARGRRETFPAPTSIWQEPSCRRSPFTEEPETRSLRMRSQLVGSRGRSWMGLERAGAFSVECADHHRPAVPLATHNFALLEA